MEGSGRDDHDGISCSEGGNFKTTERPEVLATADDVLRSLNKKGMAILDTRSDGEYLGTHVRAARGGAVPAQFTSSGQRTSTPAASLNPTRN